MKRFVLFYLLCTAHVFAISQAEIDAWKGRAPKTMQTANPTIKQLTADCGWIFRQMAPTNFDRSLGILRTKIEAALQATNETIRTERNANARRKQKTSPIADDAKEAKDFILGKMIPHLEEGEFIAKPPARR